MLSVINFIHNSTLILQEPPRTRTEAGKREMVTQSPKQPRKQERPEELVKTGREAQNPRRKRQTETGPKRGKQCPATQVTE